VSNDFTLLIWEEVPELCKLYLIPNDAITEEVGNALITAHGSCLNSVGLSDEQEDALNFLNNALVSKDSIERSGDQLFPNGYPNEKKGVLGMYQVVGEKPIYDNITAVYKAGFIL
jgi:hypothetical protein